ncbi:hypothetical protein Tco_1314551 [Tanacetum coccineum]
MKSIREKSNQIFHMAQQIVPAVQLVSKFQRIRRCNNYAKLQISKVPNTEDTIKFKLDTQEIIYTVDMFRDTINLPVETSKNPFVAPVNIQTIEGFMNRVGYQGVVDKVIALYTKNLAQPWQTMFKVFNRCLTTRTTGHDQTKINILQLFHVVVNRTNVDYAALLWWDSMNYVSQKKDYIQYPRFTKLIIADLMKKYETITPRIEEDYHSIKDDIPLVSVYTIGNVTVRGMLIPDEFLTKEIRATDDYKESTPRAHRTPTLTTASPQGKMRKQSVGESISPQKSLKITIRQKQVDEGDKYEQSYDDADDSDDRLDPGSHKENPEHVDDDDDEEKVDEKKDNEMGSLETRIAEMQTPIPTTPRSLRTILSSDKNITQELRDTVSLPTATTSKDPHSKRRISSKYSHLPEFNAQAPKIIEELFKNSVQNNVIQVHHTTTTSVETTSSTDLQEQMDDDIHSQRHNDHQEDDAPLEGEKRVKRHKTSKSSKFARGSSSKQSAKDSITYVTKQQQQQQEWDAWVEETVINEDEVIPEDETPELIIEFQNVDKRIPTIFDHARMEATLNDMLRNQFKNAEENPNEPPRYLYNKALFFLKNGNTEEKKYILSLHKIHAERFPEANLEEKMNH